MQQQFKDTVWQYFHDHGRHDLPWRQPEPDDRFDPYKIMVSEIMLQQTQVSRVMPKYLEFLGQFPSVQALAAATQADVLRAWSGLGYNRRARFLHQAAQNIITEYKGTFPQTLPDLTTLPGIGINTAGAILTYAYNQPVIFLETNIRTVFIHHFFHDQTDVPDGALKALVEATLDHERPREWYWALMDYGSYLKQTVGNLNRHSKVYAKQSRFLGSRRQIRGQVLRLLVSRSMTLNMLSNEIKDDRLQNVLDELVRERLISQEKSKYRL